MEIMSNLIKDLRSTKYYFVFRPIRPSLANLVLRRLGTLDQETKSMGI